MLLGFQARFAPLVESGEKTQTIRALRKDGRVPRIGERLYLYTGLRTKQARKLGEGMVIHVRRVQIDRFGCLWFKVDLGYETSPRHMKRVATRDGFRSYEEMRDWFKRVHGLPFEGTLIRWRLLPPPSAEAPAGATP